MNSKLPIVTFFKKPDPTQDIAAGKKPVMVKGAWTMQYQGVAARGHQFQDTGPTQFMDAFVAQMKSGHIGIFERTGGSTSEGSDAIREIMGSSVAQMVGNQQVAQGLTERAVSAFCSAARRPQTAPTLLCACKSCLAIRLRLAAFY